MLTIIACIKYVRSELISSGQQFENNYIVNPYDLYMLEQLMDFKKYVPCRIMGITMGPLGCIDIIKRSIAMGLDDAFLVSDSCFSGSDTYATSYILSKTLKHIGKADVYAFGEKAIDGETSQVPIGVASRLGLNCITGVRGLHRVEENKIVLNRNFANNFEIVESIIPCVLCFKGFITKEPQVTLLKLKQARNYVPTILTAAALNIEKRYCGQTGSKTIVKNIFHMLHKRDVEVIEGTSQLKAEKFRKLILGNGGNNY